MARLSFLRLSIFTLSKLYIRRLILFLNIAIFISFFAISATILSIFFENKIDKIEKQIITNETNDILNSAFVTSQLLGIESKDQFIFCLGILVFLTGKRDIEYFCDKVRKRFDSTYKNASNSNISEAK